MKKSITRPLLSALAVILLLSGCATIPGTLVSPVTGGVDLADNWLCADGSWLLVPPVFLGGALAGPFVAFYKGVNYDAQVFRDFDEYWYNYSSIFRPFHRVPVIR